MKKTRYVAIVVMSNGMIDRKLFEDYDKLLRYKQTIERNTNWTVLIEEL